MTQVRGFVYFASPIEGGPVKIGCSQSPKDRLVSLMSLVPYPLELLAVVPGTVNDERKLHATFLKDHLRSEWFKPSVEMWALIGRIRETGSLPAEMRGSQKQPNVLHTKNNANSIRATPEWRAKMSEIHKASWAKTKKWRAFEGQVCRFMADNSLTAEDINSSPLFADARHKPLRVRNDGTFWVDSSHQSSLETFMATYRREWAA